MASPMVLQLPGGCQNACIFARHGDSLQLYQPASTLVLDLKKSLDTSTYGLTRGIIPSTNILDLT
jgi:hypothetical protein